MEVKTKFKINDQVFLMKDNRVIQREIIGVHVDLWSKEFKKMFKYVLDGVEYSFWEDNHESAFREYEQNVYATKEELLMSL